MNLIYFFHNGDDLIAEVKDGFVPNRLDHLTFKNQTYVVHRIDYVLTPVRSQAPTRKCNMAVHVTLLLDKEGLPPLETDLSYDLEKIRESAVDVDILNPQPITPSPRNLPS